MNFKQKKMIIIPIILTVIFILGWIAYIPIWPHTKNGEWGKDNTYIIIRRMLGLEKTGSYTLLPEILKGDYYSGKIGEVISYIDHPVIAIDDVIIKYVGIGQPGNPELHTTGSDIFSVSNFSGKSFQINWSSGTGELPGPSMFKTKDGCYALNINVIEGKKLFEGVGSIPGRLVLYKKFFNGKCDNEWTKDLR